MSTSATTPQKFTLRVVPDRNGKDFNQDELASIKLHVTQNGTGWVRDYNHTRGGGGTFTFQPNCTGLTFSENGKPENSTVTFVGNTKLPLTAREGSTRKLTGAVATVAKDFFQVGQSFHPTYTVRIEGEYGGTLCERITDSLTVASQPLQRAYSGVSSAVTSSAAFVGSKVAPYTQPVTSRLAAAKSSVSELGSTALARVAGALPARITGRTTESDKKVK